MHLYPFGENTAWFAFKTTDVDRVRKLFGADRWREVGWAEGVNASYEDPEDGSAKVLVTPPIDGFVLATSCGFLGWAPGGELSTRASEWSYELDMEIHYYAAERHVDLYSWGRYRVGEGVDEYNASRELTYQPDEVILNTGTITAEERALASAFLRGEDCPHDRVAGLREELKRGLEAKVIVLANGAGVTVPAPELTGRDELHTLAALLVGVRTSDVAARWSFDPNDLDGREDADGIPSTCWLGELLL